MILVDEYLRAVALLLPKEKREDIIDELRELILSRIEAREAELGRTLTDDETETVLRQIGHPLVVAARYRDGPQHVVGPALYPYWLFAVKAAVTLQVAVAAIVFLVRAMTGDVSRALGQAIASGFTGAVMLIGIATIAAWLIERQVLRIDYLDRWRVRDLRFIGFAAWDADAWRDWFESHRDGAAAAAARNAEGRRAWRAAQRASSTATANTATPPPAAAPLGAGPPPPPWSGPAASDPYAWGKGGRGRYGRDYAYPVRRWGRSPMAHGLGGIAAGVVLLLWWLGALHFGIAGSADDFRTLGIEPGALAGFDWSGLKTALYLPVLAYVGLLVALGAVRIAHPDAVRVQGLLELAIAAVVLATVGWLWTGSPLASAVQVDSVAAFSRRVRELFQDGPPFPLAPGLTLVLAVVFFGGVIRAVRGLFELVVPTPPLWAPPVGRPV